MDSPEPIVHEIPADATAQELVESLTSRERERMDEGVHVVVHVAEGGNTGYARVADAASLGNGSQRWLQHARRGASPGGWSEAHHPRAELRVGEWKAHNAAKLDRALMAASKHAWRLEHDAPYVVEFPAVELAELGIEDPAGERE